MKKVLTFLAMIALFASCKSTTTNTSAEVELLNGAKTEDGLVYGKMLQANKVMSYEKLLTKIEKQGGVKNVKVEGKVKAVCQAKGCWMTIYSDEEGKADMMVKFKDYAFFMPKDISGKTVIMEGDAYVETTSVEELRHYAEDAGKSEAEIAKITEPKKELKFLATGVIIKEKV